MTVRLVAVPDEILPEGTVQHGKLSGNEWVKALVLRITVIDCEMSEIGLRAWEEDREINPEEQLRCNELSQESINLKISLADTGLSLREIRAETRKSWL